MRNATLHLFRSIAPACGTLACMWLAGCDRTLPLEQGGDAPLIRSFTASPAAITLGNSSLLMVDAVDPAGGALTYEYDAGLGDVFGSGPEVYYSARPCCLGLNEIVVRVRSQGGSVATASVYVLASSS
jgi:hypothetical protein